jgi:hypothetical protein
MQFQTVWTIVYLIAVSTLGFNLLTETLNAQTKISTQNTQDPIEIPIEDQARYLRGLETPSASQWSFPTNNQADISDAYQLSLSEPEIEITERKVPEWRNTGDDPNYSVLLDVNRFIEETK